MTEEIVNQDSADAPPAPPVEPVAEPPVVIAEPAAPEDSEDNKDRSNLGRKVKGIEESLKRLEGFVLQGLDTTRTVSEASVAVEDDGELLTVGEAKKRMRTWLKDVQRDDEVARTSYEIEYLSQLNRLVEAEEDPAFAATVFSAVTTNPVFNKKHSDKPERDAAENFYKAMAYTIRQEHKGTAPRPNPLKGSAAPPVKPNIPETQPAPAGFKIELDPDAAAYARSMGMSDEEVAKALKA